MSNISIIVTLYNTAAYIDELVQSILNQSIKNWECIIIDDGSTDDAKKNTEKYISDKIHYHYQENKGVCVARNLGIKLAKNEYIIFLDGDDILNPYALENAINAYKENPNALLIFSDTTSFNEDGALNTSNLENSFTLKDLLVTNKLFISSVIKLENLKGVTFDENMPHLGEDWEFWINLYAKNREKAPIKIPYQIFKYRKHQNSAFKNNNQAELKFLSNTYIYNKHRTLYDEFHSTYINVLNRKFFYEKKLEKIYNSKFYKFYNSILKLLKK